MPLEEPAPVVRSVAVMTPLVRKYVCIAIVPACS